VSSELWAAGSGAKKKLRVMLKLGVTGKIARKFGNGERSRKVAKPQKGTQRIL
jgi:hypothetical protein